MTTGRLSKKMFPASLLLDDRRCLVVGGGRVAARKAIKLLEAGADLAVVAPSIREQIKALLRIDLRERTFKDSDLDGVYLAFAVTDDAVLNRRIVELCAERGILCSAADASWSDGDLILPATFSEDGLTVAISTGGRSCRRSRLLRESLFRHVEFLQNVDLFILGADHQDASFQMVEKLKARRSEFEKILPCIQGVHEFMILDTCNRFEIMALLSRGQSYDLIKHQIIGLTPLAEGMDAFRRFSEIAAGLRSQAFGETRIVAQIKESLHTAKKNRWAGSFLQGWVDTTLCISKEIRQIMEPNIPAIEVEDLVTAFGRIHFKESEKMLIIGRGEVGEGLSKRFPDAAQISGREDQELQKELPEAGVILCATGSPDFILTQTHRGLLKPGVVLVDLSLPRNIDPALPGVIGLSELRSAVQPARAEEVLASAREIINTHAADYERLVNF